MPHPFVRPRPGCSRLRRRARKPSLAWFALLCLLCIAPWPALSAPTGRIQGVVQQAEKAIANHRIMLIRFGPGQEVNRTPGETDAEGGFSFEGLETGGDFNYVVGIRYEGTFFRSESMQLSDNETKSDVLIEVGAEGRRALGPSDQQGDQAAQVLISHHVMAIFLKDDRLEVREMVSLQNPGSAPYRGGEQGKYAFHLPLPKDYDNLHDIQGLAQDQIRSDAFGLYYTAPLEPGAHRLAYRYALPMTGRVRTVLLRRSLPTRMIDVFTDATDLVASSDFQYMGQLPSESHTFLHFRGGNAEPGARNWVQITRLAEGVSSLIQMVSYGLIVAIALLGLAIPLYSRWRRTQARASSAPTAEQIQQWQAERDQLLFAIARLDNAHEAGTLDEPDYRQRRQAHKQQLRRVAEALHQADDSLGAPSLAAQKGSA